MIVRLGLHELPGLLDELGVNHPYLITTHRWLELSLPLEPIDSWASSPTHEVERVAEFARGAGVLLALGGGSTIDLAKAVSAETELPLVSIPTTYSGAEWTTFYGVRDIDRLMRGGGAGANPAGIVYDPQLTLELPPAESCGTALNALAHCAEALYVEGRNDEADRHALAGARLIARWLPPVLDDGHDLEARTGLLEGACEGGAALGGSFLALGHAMAQALGGRYGLPHGALNAICLPAALRFNAEAVPDAVARLGEAMGTDDPAAWVESQARKVGFTGLGALGVPEEDLDEIAEATAQRAGAKANPRPATAAQIAGLLRAVW
jgi:maleylacetate reductase